MATHWNESLCRLRGGDFEIGWKKYELRWQTKLKGTSQRNFLQPLWLGQAPLRGKTILLHAEQGLGDTIQFCRYAELVAAQGATVLLEVQPPLKMLLAGLPGVSRVFARGEPLPAFDCHCPLLSLPLACGTRLDSVPAAPFYLSAVPDAVQVWERRMGEKTRPHIGLAWSGNSLNPTDRSRSISLSQLRSLLSPRMRFVSLQKEVRDTDRQALQDLTGIFHPHTLGDFTDTARLIATLDLVITVDTSIAHLAGAMGKPVWILLAYGADWRWLLHREDSPWYPSARLFRQTGIGQWDSVLGKVARELEARF